MRVALFTEIYDCGGIDTFIVNLINSWPAGDDTFVIVANASYPGLQVIEANVTRPIDVIRHHTAMYSTLWSRGFVFRVVRKLARPVLQYVFMMYNVVAFRRVLRETRAHVLMIVNGGYPGGDSCRAAAISWGLFNGKDSSIHNFHNIAHAAPWYTSLQERIVDSVLSHFTKVFVTVSKAAADSMSIRPAISARRTTTFIHNGIADRPLSAPASETIKDELGISAATPLCLMLATYEPRKGHYFLLQAFRKVLDKVPDAHLLICGFGFPHEVDQVRTYVRKFALEGCVHLMAFRTDASHLLAGADVLVVASQEYESFGLTSVEAMAQKVPVVATDAGGIPEVVLNGEGGYCVDRADLDAYANRIVMLLRDPELRRLQGRLGFKRYQEYFRATVMAAKYFDLMRTIPDDRSSSFRDS